MSFEPQYLQALYTDGTPVMEGDRIRSRQQPGGILPPAPETEGVAGTCPWEKTGTLYLVHIEKDWKGRERTCYKHIFSHITERI